MRCRRVRPFLRRTVAALGKPVSGPLSIRNTFGGPPAVAKTDSSSTTRRSAVIERSTRCNSEHRVCSSITDAILIALASTVESNWKSIAHTTFGASASTGGIEDTGPVAAVHCRRYGG